MIDLETLWYGVIAASILFYTVLDGFDLGVGALHLFARNELQRRTFLNAIGPVWDGNEVWLVIVMGGMFAGFPNAYASVFSGFYTLLMVLIAGLIFRAVAIEFRSKRESFHWRQTWDIVFSFSSILVAFILGLILGNMVEGVPLNASQDFVADFSYFFSPYAILVGITAVLLFAMHGAIYLAMKTDGETYEVVRYWIWFAIALFLIFYFLVTILTLIHKPHMTLRFEEMPYLLLLPCLSLLAILNIPRLISKGLNGWAFIFSCLSIFFLLALYGLGTFPIIVLSTIDPLTNSLTIYNTASSANTLKNLMVVVAIGIPLVIAYGFWIYHIFRGKVRLDKTSY
jgi:cytochrome d ubiquinol oxidase subunit II